MLKTTRTTSRVCVIKKALMPLITQNYSKGVEGKCKHGVTIPMFLNRTSETSLENLSCTDIKQTWSKLKNDTEALYTPIPLRQFCHFAKAKNYCEVSTNINVLDILLKGAPNSALQMLKRRSAVSGNRLNYCNESFEQELAVLNDCRKVAGKILKLEISSALKSDSILYSLTCTGESIDVLFEDLQPSVQLFYKREISITFEDSLDVCCKTVHQQNEIWKNERRKRITGSVAYGIYTYCKNKSPDWDKKIENYLNPTFKGTVATRHGLKYEDKAIAAYEKLKNKKVTRLGLLINPIIPWLAYSADGIIEDERLIEIKSPAKLGKTSGLDSLLVLPYLKLDGENLVLTRNHTYFCQIQLGMFVSGLNFCDFVIYCANDDNCTILTINFEPVIVNDYLCRLQYVYFAYLLPRLALELMMKPTRI